MDNVFSQDHTYTANAIQKALLSIKGKTNDMEYRKLGLLNPADKAEAHRRYRSRKELFTFLHAILDLAKADKFTVENVFAEFEKYNTITEIDYIEEKNSLEFTPYDGRIRWHIHINPKPIK